jgi:GTP-binding protein Era
MFQSGFIGIIGRPNVGKSTLLNGLMGEKIAITTHKPQTTRNRITGIRNLQNAQLIFMDTPGIHRASTPLNQFMVNVATDTLRTVDILLFLVEAPIGVHRDDRFIIESLKNASIPAILVINKMDLVKKPELLPLIDEYQHLYSFVSILPMSARTGEGMTLLLDEVLKILPEGPPYFPEETMTDRSERFIAAEMIREKIILLTHKEIPYVTAVVVDAFKEEATRPLIHIQATIHVEKPSQKGILIGKKGAMLKAIGSKARIDMEKFFASRIFLELFVRVQKDWTHDEKMLREFGYSNQ